MRPNTALAFFFHGFLLLAFWLTMSGMFDPFHLSLGVVSVIATLTFHFKLLRHREFHDNETSGAKLSLPKLISYFALLFWSIIHSSLKVAYLIAHPRLMPKSVVISFRVHLPGMASKVMLANSITLTPGTVTLDIVGEDRFIVHALMHPKDAEEMDHSLAYALGKSFGLSPEQIISDESVITLDNSRQSWIYS